MNVVIEQTIRQEQVESYGRIMAGFAHDMKNHLGIIRESNGLMSDLIEMGGFVENEIPVERFKKAISSIEQRVIIVADLLHHLSSFAHRSDTPYSSFHINDLITEELTFLERFARLQQITVTFNSGEELPSTYNDPSLFQHVFFRLYCFCLEQLDPGQHLSIITDGKGGSIEIALRLTGRPELNLESAIDNNLQAAIKKMGCSLEIIMPKGDYADISLTVPSLPGD